MTTRRKTDPARNGRANGKPPVIEKGDPAVVVTVKAPKVIYQIHYQGYNAAGDLIDEKPDEWDVLYAPDFDKLPDIVKAKLDQVRAQTLAAQNGSGP